MSETKKPAPKREAVGGEGGDPNEAVQDEFSQYGGSYVLDPSTGKRERVAGPDLPKKEGN